MTTRDLTSLLEESTEHLPGIDLAEAAWADALHHRASRRRRALAGVATVAAVAVAAAGLSSIRDDAPPKPPAPAVSSTTAPEIDSAVDGTPYVTAPNLGTEASLPRLGNRLPEEIATDGGAARLSDPGTGSPGHRVSEVALVYLRPLSDNTFRPVFVQPDGLRIEADTVTLHTVGEPAGVLGLHPLGAGAVDREGRRVVFPQPSQVVIVDTFSGSVTRVPVADGDLRTAGWSGADSGVVATSTSKGWFLDAATLKPTQVGTRSSADHYQIVPRPSGPDSLLVWDAFGQQTGIAGMFSPATEAYGDTVGSLEGWAASGVYFPGSALGLRGGAPEQLYQGILAVQADQTPRRRMLVFADLVGSGLNVTRFKGCCRPLAWASGHDLLFQSQGTDANWVLSWDITSGDVKRVTHLVGRADVPVAIGPQ